MYPLAYVQQKVGDSSRQAMQVVTRLPERMSAVGTAPQFNCHTWEQVVFVCKRDIENVVGMPWYEG